MSNLHFRLSALPPGSLFATRFTRPYDGCRGVPSVEGTGFPLRLDSQAILLERNRTCVSSMGALRCAASFPLHYHHAASDFAFFQRRHCRIYFVK